MWTTAKADEPVLERFSVRAVPRDQDGRPMAEKTLVEEEVLRVRVVAEPAPAPESDDGGLPSLHDALSAGWTVLSTLANVAAVAIAFAVPFLWIPALLMLVAWWWRRRRDRAG